ncbi:sugar phosphate isomerase/epimerase [soil metagenome]
MVNSNRPRLSVSSWSLHRSLGRPQIYGPETSEQQSATPTSTPAFTLLELPARIAAAGIHTLEICHFHIPSREPAYLQQLRAAIEAAGVEFWELLIDAGDVTDTDHAERDITWIESWIDVASALGASRARVIAGKAEPSIAALTTSQRALGRLAQYAQVRGVRLMTENFYNLTSNPDAVLTLLDGLKGEVGLLADFGNWKGPQKYADLAKIFPRAEACHAKCHFTAPGQMEREDYVRCLELTRDAGFAGPYTLIYDGPGDDEFEGLRLEAEVVAAYL